MVYVRDKKVQIIFSLQRKIYCYHISSLGAYFRLHEQKHSFTQIKIIQIFRFREVHYTWSQGQKGTLKSKRGPEPPTAVTTLHCPIAPPSHPIPPSFTSFQNGNRPLRNFVPPHKIPLRGLGFPYQVTESSPSYASATLLLLHSHPCPTGSSQAQPCHHCGPCSNDAKYYQSAQTQQ